MIRTLVDRFLDLFLVRRDEIGVLAILGTNLFFSIHALIISQIVAESLFLSSYGREVLVYMYGAAGLSAAAAGFAYARVQQRVRPGRFEPAALVVFALCFLALWPAAVFAAQWIHIVLLIFAEVFGTLIIIQAWSVASTLLSARSAKRLVPVIGGFGTVAGISAGTLVGTLAEVIGTANLIALVLASLAGCLAMTGVLGRRMASVPAGRQSAKAKTRPQHDEVRALQLYRNRFFLILVSMTTTATLASIFVDYQFKVFSQDFFTVAGQLDKDGLSEFYGYFQIVVTTLALVVTFGLASRVLERYGLVATLILLPLVIVLGTVGIMFGIGGYLFAATVARGGDKVLRFSVYGSANQILYLALPDRLQKHARAIANGVWRPMTILAASALLVLLTGPLEFTDPEISYVTASVGLVWIALSVTTGRQYLAQLMLTVERRRIHFEKGKTVIEDPAAVEEILASLTLDNPATVLEALALCERVGQRDMSPEIERLLTHEDPRIRRRALIVARQRGDMLSDRALAPLIWDPETAVRVEAIKAYGASSTAGRSAMLTRLIDAEDVAIRGAAIAAAIANRVPGSDARAEEGLAEMLGSPDTESRIEGLEALSALPRERVVEPLQPLLDDPVPRVRDRAVRIAAEIQDARLHHVLVRQIRESTARPLVVDAFRGAGESVVAELAGILMDEASGIRAKQLTAHILGNVGSDAALEALLQRMRHAGFNPPIASAKAAAGIVASQGRVLARDRAAPILNEILQRLYQMTAWRVDTRTLAREGNLDFLDALIRDRRRRYLDTLFWVLRMLYPAHTIDVAQRYLYDRSLKRRENALEILSQTLSRADKRVVIPQLESSSPEQALGSAGSLLTIQRKRAEIWIDEWLQADDPWLRAASLWALSAIDPDQRHAGLIAASLRAEHPLLRETAAVVLSRRYDREVTRGLFNPLLRDPDAIVRARAEALLAV